MSGLCGDYGISVSFNLIRFYGGWARETHELSQLQIAYTIPFPIDLISVQQKKKNETTAARVVKILIIALM